ncbi:ABC transporter ATP-binding protein [Acetanaerobacterium elongatum]|uniref:ABC-2 type transport system ATP-binding protein n=1 Tax=Acetanaerobacterium elongatum TaxID=258515 RepID=A0A1H0DTH8_9FIRM|nr:ABC transporter ATP-binding protein [Acetanaerobacterium elongatum]SDN73388.1 ABC-2 type transport system ATP-binding protein [Acetanaerobacterium elongatum]
MNAITLHELTKNYGSARGIKNVNLEIQKGEFFGFIGPNGAGKSTTIKLLFNFIFPSGGSVEVLGMDSIKDTAKIKQITGYVPGEVRYYADMKADELFKTTMAFHKKTDVEELNRLCTLFEIEQNKRLGELSLGNRKKVAIVSALCFEPELIVLDEPTSGLDPLMQRTLFEVLKESCSRGTTVFLSSHNLTEVQEHCSKAAFIKEGEIIGIEDFTLQQQPEKLVALFNAQSIEPMLNSEATVLSEENGKVLVLYKGDPARLAQVISECHALDFTVEKPSLETRFLSYYKGGTER